MKYKKLLVLGIFLLPPLVVGGIYFLRPQPNSTPPTPPGLTADRKLELLRDKSIALGYMENSEFDQALPLLEALTRELPDEPLGFRNLALALFNPNPLNNESSIAATDAARIDRLQKTVERLLQIDAQSYASQYLAGRVFAKLGELKRVSDAAQVEALFGKARKCYAEAGRLSPQDPGPLFEVYDLAKKFGDPEHLPEEALKALRGAHRREPENLACALELLEQFMIRKDPERVMLAEHVLKLVPGDVDTVQEGARPRLSLEKVAGLLRQHANDVPATAFNDLGDARSKLRQVLPSFKRDESRLRPHPLEFIAQDFRPSFYGDLAADAEPAIDVKFTPFEPWKDVPKDLLAARRDDLTCANDYALVMLRKAEGKTRVETIVESARWQMPPIDVDGAFTGLELADLDLDWGSPPQGAKDPRNIPADLDLILYGSGGVRLLENQPLRYWFYEVSGQRRWVDRTADCKLPPLSGVRWLLCCDMDHDGNLDLIVWLEKGVKILRNRGAWAFDDITSRSTGLELYETIAAVYGDFDRDGDLDVMMLRKDGLLLMLVNGRGGKFTVRDTGVRVDQARCLTAADLNGDGRLDFLVGHFCGIRVLFADAQGLPSQKANGQLSLRVESAKSFNVNSIGVLDHDNDGWPDFWLANDLGTAWGLYLFRNVGGSRFDEASKALTGVSPRVWSVQSADLDNDGDLDLFFVTDPGQISALRNDGGNKNHWLSLRLQAELNKDAAGQGQGTKSNFRGIGGTAEIRSGRHYQMQQVTGAATHFGLGLRKNIDTVRVMWTNGVPQVSVRPNANETLAQEQRLKGSCPYLFAWDGERFVFVTDCLWSSALGMKLAQDVDMPHDRQHNYLVIPGEKLKPRDGRYVLKFTNELWEVPYLDQAQLWAVDHPADVEIFTNQRIPPDPKEEFRIVTAKVKRYPRSAQDHRGSDVLATINRRDGNYLGRFKRLRYYGLAEPHWVELDLGDVSQAKQATLFLTGWIWPTDTTGNVAISQDPRFQSGAQPPALLVPDGKGGWTTAMPMIGFQSGKLQSVVVPLPLAAFPKGDYRVRIATSMELYWDEIFFTTDETAAEHELKKLPVAEAQLQYRGYSRIHRSSPTSPHLFDYDDVDPTPRWLPIAGKYVRYGTVTELLHQPDDCYVVMSPGDELTLAFAELPAPRPGWKRSFIFYGNGWLKDFDMNGGGSDSIAPYPFEGMSRYPYAEPEVYPSSGVHGRFLKEYLIRQVEAAEFWDQLRPNAAR